MFGHGQTVCGIQFAITTEILSRKFLANPSMNI